ncbi:MAG: hypothetical protein SVK54_05505, partial [candidate division WOR-3 bacterium]|nr:hypothetical protein [candidate division WOR-3 bacterium]
MKRTILFITLLIISLSIISQELVEVGSWEYGPTEAVAVKDSTAYISSGKYLWVIDISDESNPVLVDELYLEEYINFIRVLGNYMYVSRNDSLLHIYSVHNQHSPVLEGTESMGQYNGTEHTASDITFKEDTIFVSRYDASTIQYFLNDSINLQKEREVGGGAASLEVSNNIAIDYTNQYISSYDLTQSGDIYMFNDFLTYGDYVRSLAISPNEQYVYVGLGKAGINIVRINTVDTLVKKDSVYTGGITYDVELIEDTILIAGKGMKGIGIYDVDNDTIFTELGSCDTDGFVYELEVIGDRVYAGARSGGLIIIDISDKTNPTVLGSYEGHSELRGFDIKGDRLYAAGADGGLCIYDITAGNSLSFVSKTYTRYISEDVSVDDSFAYVAEGDSGLTILDITNESNPSIVGYLDIPYFARQSGVYQNTCVVGGNNNEESQYEGISVVNITDRLNPVISDTILRQREDVVFDLYKDLLHCVGFSAVRHYEIWDIGNPDNIVFKDSTKAVGFWYEYVIADSAISFLSINSRDTVKCIDVSNPDSIYEASHINPRSYGINMEYHNGLLYESTRLILYVYDFTDIHNPVEVTTYEQGFYTEEMKHSGEY